MVMMASNTDSTSIATLRTLERAWLHAQQWTAASISPPRMGTSCAGARRACMRLLPPVLYSDLLSGMHRELFLHALALAMLSAAQPISRAASAGRPTHLRHTAWASSTQ